MNFENQMLVVRFEPTQAEIEEIELRREYFWMKLRRMNNGCYSCQYQ